MQKILITGGSGLLALNFAFALRDKAQVTVIAHTRIIDVKRIKVLNLSLDSVNKLTLAINKIAPDYVIHTAGLTSIEQCELDPRKAYYVNTQLTENVAIACINTETPFNRSFI